MDTAKYNIDPIGVTGKEGRSSNRVSNDTDLGSKTNFDVVGGTNVLMTLSMYQSPMFVHVSI